MILSFRAPSCKQFSSLFCSLTIATCAANAQTWPSSAPYPSDFPPYPDPSVSVSNGGQFPFEAVHTDPMGDKIVYSWKEEIVSSQNSEPVHSYERQSREMIRKTFENEPTDGLLLKSVSGFGAVIINEYRDPHLGLGLQGEGYSSGKSEDFGYTIQVTNAGNPQAVQATQTRTGAKRVYYNTALDSGSIQYSSRTIQVPLHGNPTIQDCNELVSITTVFTPTIWSVYRKVERTGQSASTHVLDENNSWPNSGGTGSDTFQQWPGVQNPILSHQISLSILHETCVTNHVCNLFSDLPLTFWSMVSW